MITLQTLITNKIQARTIRYIGKGIYLDKDQSMVVDGAYPASCVRAADVQCLTYEYENGLIDLSLITNLKTCTPTAKEGKTSNAAAVANKVKEPNKDVKIIRGDKTKGMVNVQADKNNVSISESIMSKKEENAPKATTETSSDNQLKPVAAFDKVDKEDKVVTKKTLEDSLPPTIVIGEAEPMKLKDAKMFETGLDTPTVAGTTKTPKKTIVRRRSESK
jgi:hypothetical protein